jgi:hypothetical protein
MGLIVMSDLFCPDFVVLRMQELYLITRLKNPSIQNLQGRLYESEFSDAGEAV